MTARAIPNKLFHRINEVADILGVEAYVLRYWETRFPMLKPERFGNDERRYRRKDIELLLRIRGLLYEEKFTIAGAVEQLRKGRGERTRPEPANQAAAIELDASATSPETLVSLRDRLRGIREELLELREG